ncbi:uncharacterized protein [Montipora capricornis]|uniref:uncharacterized protein n=1 Tax=Montipora capricornis TaxID=246305 RepID=UPI0035F109DC
MKIPYWRINAIRAYRLLWNGMLQCMWTTRAMIAAKIHQGVTRERILANIRESVGETFCRQQLLERQDLANLERAKESKRPMLYFQ